MTATTQPTKRELELELEVWQARLESVQNGVVAINAQAAALQARGKECQSHIERLRPLVTPLPTPVPDGGGGPGEETGGGTGP
jgi:hypothetical protein